QPNQLFYLTALSTPVTATIKPQETVARSTDRPELAINYPDGYYLRRNLVAVNDPTIASPAAVQEFSLNSQTTSTSSIFLAFNSATRAPVNSAGSLQMTYAGKTPGNASIVKTFQYPYRGPPQRFEATVALLTRGTNQSG